MNVSRSCLFRAFMDILYKSPKTYLKEIRIREACVLLQMTNFPVSEVADKTGFADSLYFSKVFRLMVGKTPTEFRKDPEIPVQLILLLYAHIRPVKRRTQRVRIKIPAAQNNAEHIE